MSKEIHYSPDMVCPYCGNDEFFIKQRYTGTCNYNMRFDGNDDVENGDMYASARFITTSKYTYCNKCFKKLFKVEELSNEYL